MTPGQMKPKAVWSINWSHAGPYKVLIISLACYRLVSVYVIGSILMSMLSQKNSGFQETQQAFKSTS